VKPKPTMSACVLVQTTPGGATELIVVCPEVGCVQVVGSFPLGTTLRRMSEIYASHRMKHHRLAKQRCTCADGLCDRHLGKRRNA
jgi:hypothetical protein